MVERTFFESMEYRLPKMYSVPLMRKVVKEVSSRSKVSGASWSSLRTGWPSTVRMLKRPFLLLRVT